MRNTGKFQVHYCICHQYVLDYRSTLFAYVARAKNRTSDSTSAAGADTSSHVNYRFMSTPEKEERMHALHKEKRALQQKVRRLQSRLGVAMETGGITLEEDVSNDFEAIMEDENEGILKKHSKDSFEYIFWNQQQLALTKEGKAKKGIRWHPLMIKWCLYLRHQSSKAYETLRESGCVALPSQRTLRDYSNAVKASAGFSCDVDGQLLGAANLTRSPSYHSLVAILIDEMHVKEDLVYNKHTGQLVGFVDLGSINNHLTRFEQLLLKDDVESNTPLAKSIVVFMVRGLFSTLKFPYVQFPCSSLTGEQLFMPFWEVVFRLERMGFKVNITPFSCML